MAFAAICSGVDILIDGFVIGSVDEDDGLNSLADHDCSAGDCRPEALDADPEGCGSVREC